VQHVDEDYRMLTEIMNKNSRDWQTGW